MNRARAVAFLSFLSLSAAVSGCASKTSAPMLAALAAVPAVPTPSVCDATSCKEQWERAQVWVAKHSRWKIQTATDVQIATFNPTGDEVQRASYGISVLKEPAESGRYRITLSLSCGSTGPLISCDPKPVDIQRAFYHYIQTGKDVLEGLALSGIRMP